MCLYVMFFMSVCDENQSRKSDNSFFDISIICTLIQNIFNISIFCSIVVIWVEGIVKKFSRNCFKMEILYWKWYKTFCEKYYNGISFDDILFKLISNYNYIEWYRGKCNQFFVLLSLLGSLVSLNRVKEFFGLRISAKCYL